MDIIFLSQRPWCLLSITFMSWWNHSLKRNSFTGIFERSHTQSYLANLQSNFLNGNYFTQQLTCQLRPLLPRNKNEVMDIKIWRSWAQSSGQKCSIRREIICNKVKMFNSCNIKVEQWFTIVVLVFLGYTSCSSICHLDRITWSESVLN